MYMYSSVQVNIRLADLFFIYFIDYAELNLRIMESIELNLSNYLINYLVRQDIYLHA